MPTRQRFRSTTLSARGTLSHRDNQVYPLLAVYDLTEPRIGAKNLGAKKKSSTSDDPVALYEKLIATIPEIKRKGAANPYTALNGNMFTLLHQSCHLAIRLPEEKRNEFLKNYKTKLFAAYGTVMPEYVAVSDSLFKDTKALQKHLQANFEYVKTLRPKATRTKNGRASPPASFLPKELSREERAPAS